MSSEARPTDVFRVLLVEDSPADADFVLDRLSGGADVVHASTLAAALAELERGSFDGILLDLHLPDSVGLATLERMRARAGDCPVIVLSGMDQSAFPSLASEGGAEFVRKDDVAHRFFPNAIRSIVERHRANDRQRQLAALVDSSPDAMLVVGQTGVVRYVNAATVTLFARSESELLGERLHLAVTPGVVTEVNIFRPGLESRVGEIVVAALDWHGERALLVTVRDVTVRKQSEAFQARSERLEAENRVKEAFLAELAAANAALAAQNEALSRAKAAADVLLREVHHRVKNNLQIISSLLHLQSDQLTSPSAVASFKDACHRVDSIARAHEHLYRGDDLGSVAFAPYLQSIVVPLVEACAPAGALQIVYELPDVRMPLHVAIPCGLIVNELVTNALKHAFPGGRAGTITVSLRVAAADGRFELAVADDGVGAGDGTADLRSSFGMELVDTFAEHLDAEWELSAAGGVRVSVRFADPRLRTSIGARLLGKASGFFLQPSQELPTRGEPSAES